MKEGQLQRAITTWLTYLQNAKRLFFTRNNVFRGRIIRRDGSQGFMSNGQPGLADLLIFMPLGRTVFVELKGEGGRQTHIQAQFEQTIKSLGYEYYLVTSQDQLEEILFYHKGDKANG